MEGNQYFEQQVKRFIGSQTNDDLIRRSKECQLILDHLNEDKVWEVIISDCKKWVDQLNNNWQNCYDEKQLAQMRVLKFAYNHIFSFPEKYAEEYKYVLDELDKRNTEENVDKDYDLETNLEE